MYFFELNYYLYILSKVGTNKRAEQIHRNAKIIKNG